MIQIFAYLLLLQLFESEDVCRVDVNAITNDFSQIQPFTLLTRSSQVGHFVFF